MILAATRLAAVVGAAALLACTARADAKSPTPATAPPAAVTTVSLTPARAVNVTAHGDVTGQLQPAKALQLGFEVGGRLMQVLVKKGAPVAEGQLLARLDPEMADAQLQAAEAGLQAAEAQAAMATDTAERNKTLRDGNAVSEWQARSTQSQAAAAVAQVAQVKAQVAQARAARKRHDLRAPFPGVLIDCPDQVGASLGPNAPLFTLEQLDPLVLKVAVAEIDRPLLRLGAKVRVEATGSGLATDDATVKTILPSADAQTKRVPVEITVPNKQGLFTAHTLARAQLSLGSSQPAMSVPASAVASVGGDHVFVVGQGGEVRQIPVTVLDRGPKEIVVRTSEPLLQIIDYPAVDLAQGMKVSVR
jgi:RND family efflux transporter MFP subunit